MTIGTPMLGTRARQGQYFSHPEQQHLSRTFTRDVGMTKNVTASITFVDSATQQLQAAGGTFAAFAVDDVIEISGSNLNDGFKTVTATDASTFLTCDPGVQSEGPITATVRTP